MKLLKKMKTLMLTVLVLSTLFMVPTALSQTNFSPPSLLPAEDVDIGGRGDACIGLATMIRTGNIHLRNIPCFVKFFTQTLIAVAGSLSVIFVMLGGYMYIVGNDEIKTKGKKTIIYALVGLVVSLAAWIIVDLVLQVATE